MSDDDTLFKKYWPADLQIVGKDIIRFHAIYWPIFLMALDLPLPKKIFAHCWVMMKDGKMSKSKGNVIYPDFLIERYGLDATKYFLLQALPYSQDGTFSPEDFVERFNSDLCNDLGNLLNRTVAMINKYFDGNISKYTGQINEQDADMEHFAKMQCKLVENAIEDLHISNSLTEIWALISRTNKYIDETAPWVLAKDESEEEKLESVMYHLAENLRKIGILLTPFLPNTAKGILEQLGINNDELRSWDSLDKYDGLENIKVIEKGIPLFMRLDTAVEVEYIKNGMK